MNQDIESIVKNNITQTQQDIKSAITLDVSLTNLIRTHDALTDSLDSLIKHLRKGIAPFLPELEHKTPENKTLLNTLKKEKASTLQKGTLMGAPIPTALETYFKEQATLLLTLLQQQTTLFTHLENLTSEHAPNLHALCGIELTARLIAQAGSLQKLAYRSAGYVQLLGSQKALFKALETTGKTPKHGIIYTHPLVKEAPAHCSGKIARHLADKIIIAARLDHFKGEQQGRKLLTEVTTYAHALISQIRTGGDE